MTREDDEAETDAGGQGLGRTLALSDGIFAIAMTLLAFQTLPSDLKGDPAHHLTRTLGGLGDRYFAFVLTFLVLGMLWLSHHRLFSRIAEADEVLMGVNLLFLMTVAALPFPSALLGQYGSESASVVLYASAMSVASVLLMLMSLTARHRDLLLPGTTDAWIRSGLWRSGTTTAVFLVAIPVALIAPSVGPLTFIALLPVRLITHRRMPPG